MQQIKISAKELGELALPTFCPRCFWIKRHVKNLPFQIFPGIFSSIDSYTKKITANYFSLHQTLMKWLTNSGIFGTPITVPHHNKFQVFHADSRVLLTGAPDEMIQLPDGAYIILDYKTARYTGTQDNLFPLYEIQLSAYAYIAEGLNFKPVKNLFLVYYEPITEMSREKIDSVINDNGFELAFSGKVVPVPIKKDDIEPLLGKVRQIYELSKPPERGIRCKDCQAIDEIIKCFS